MTASSCCGRTPTCRQRRSSIPARACGASSGRFASFKSTLELRPLFHHNDDTRIGHIVASFLALRLEVDLRRRLDEKASGVSWPTLMRDLKNLRAVDLQLADNRYRIRTDPGPAALAAFRAAEMRPAARIRQIPTERSAKNTGEGEILS